MKETRMDRIERETGELLLGIREEQAAIAALREAIEADRMKNKEEFERVWKSQEKTDEQQRKTDESLRKVHDEILELKESQKKTDRQLDKTIKKLDKIGVQLGNMGIIDGKVAEDLFYRNVRHIFRRKDLGFSSVRRNMKKADKGEYDIVAVGENRVLVVEVKKKMELSMVDEFVSEKIPKFRQIFPEYRDFSLVGGVGALLMQDNISRYAEKKGLYVLTQNGEGGAMLTNRENFRAKEF